MLTLASCRPRIMSMTLPLFHRLVPLCFDNASPNGTLWQQPVRMEYIPDHQDALVPQTSLGILVLLEQWHREIEAIDQSSPAPMICLAIIRTDDSRWE